MTGERRNPTDHGSLLLLVGAVVGIALAASGLNHSGTPATGPLDANAIARVNGVVIPRTEFERALRNLRADRRNDGNEDDAALRQRAMARLINEELLVQRALELGLARRDPRVRADLSAAMIDLIVARAQQDDRQPDTAELRAFYDHNPALFRAPPLLRVRRWHRDRLEAAQAMLRRARAGVLPGAGSRRDDPLPKGLLPPAKLQDYIGPTALRAVLQLPLAAFTEPLRTESGWQILRLEERHNGVLADFDSQRPRVLEEYRRHAGDRRLRAFLASQRARARIELSQPNP